MGQVVCINDKEWYKPCECPSFGEVVTVSLAYIDYENDPVYELKEYGDEHVFSQRYFILLSSIDETEMTRNYKTEKI